MAQVYETTASIDQDVELPNIESSASGISWGAIAGGAVGAVAVSVVLASLGSALGLASVSPWANSGASLAAIGVGAAVWIVVIQWLASAFGGYLTGRLRTKWAAMGTDEVMFRDTAHGFLAWALSTIFVVAFLATAVGGGANVAASVVTGAAQTGVQAAGDMPYLVDTLFRPGGNEQPVVSASPANSSDTSTGTPAFTATTTPTSASAPSTADTGNDFRGESERLLARSVTSDMPAEDRTYLAQLVAQHTGLSQAEAETRVDSVVASAKKNAEAARKAGVTVAFITALSLVIGAFVAAAAGALGGRHRDEI